MLSHNRIMIISRSQYENGLEEISYVENRYENLSSYHKSLLEKIKAELSLYQDEEKKGIDRREHRHQEAEVLDGWYVWLGVI